MTELNIINKNKKEVVPLTNPEVGMYLHNRKTDSLALIANLESPDVFSWGILELSKVSEPIETVYGNFTDFKNQILTGSLASVYEEVDLDCIEYTFGDTYVPNTPEESEPEPETLQLGDVFLHVDSKDLVVLVNYEADVEVTELVSLKTGYNMESYQNILVNDRISLGDTGDRDNVLTKIKEMCRTKKLVKLSSINVAYTPK